MRQGQLKPSDDSLANDDLLFPSSAKSILPKANKMLKAEEGAEQQLKVGHWCKNKEKC